MYLQLWCSFSCCVTSAAILLLLGSRYLLHHLISFCGLTMTSFVPYSPLDSQVRYHPVNQAANPVHSLSCVLQVVDWTQPSPCITTISITTIAFHHSLFPYCLSCSLRSFHHSSFPDLCIIPFCFCFPSCDFVTYQRLPLSQTGQPSCQPSSQPSAQPVVRPSMQPSVQPSESPSMRPAVQPTCQPTQQVCPSSCCCCRLMYIVLINIIA